jgi:hypothetical protein
MTAALRSPEVVMSAARAAATVPTALSFPRAAMRELVRGRYRLDKLRFELDAEGRGEILYRLAGDGRTFHFFLLSDKLPESAKTDRNYAASWDAMGVLCQGEWCEAREAHLRREVPKQRAGFADYDALIYARGNRSARVFDQVVASLAEGRQPDLALVAPIGYILRTTAFIGNGQVGTRAWAGFGRDHPLRRPYHAQFCSAFALREFVFDLVDHIARARSTKAVRLAPAYRRYLGLGNSAATGLAAFAANHPHFMHRWTMAGERALVAAAALPTYSDPVTRLRFELILDKAIQYHAEGERPSDGVFATPQSIVPELAKIRRALDAHATWASLREWAERQVSRDAREIMDALVIEVHPDIVEALADAFEAEERCEIDPGMTVAALRDLVHDDYRWALERPAAAYHFWYRSSTAPRDVRRGLRGREPALEWETTFDTALMVQRLAERLREVHDRQAVADFVHAHADLRHIVARVQSLAGCQYAELRQQVLAADYAPFATIRFPLSFFGMEKFEAAHPKSVRGVFMQGAPIAEDVARGRDGDWPFPLLPDPGADPEMDLLDPLPGPARTYRAPAAAWSMPVLRIAPNELARMVQTALQGHGVPLGVAEDAGWMVAFAQSRGEPAVAAAIAWCSAPDARSALVTAPSAFDRACAGLASIDVPGACDGWLAQELALRAARRGLAGLVAWRGGCATAGPGGDGPWFARGTLAVAAPVIPPEVGYVVACFRPQQDGDEAPFRLSTSTRWSGGEMREQRDASYRDGIPLTREEYDALTHAGRALLLPHEHEWRVLAKGMDPLKSF